MLPIVVGLAAQRQYALIGLVMLVFCVREKPRTVPAHFNFRSSGAVVLLFRSLTVCVPVLFKLLHEDAPLEFGAGEVDRQSLV